MVIQSRIVLTSVTPGCRPVRQTRIAETALYIELAGKHSKEKLQIRLD